LTGRPAGGLWTFGEAVDRLVACIDRGGVLAIPTESSYGLAVDPSNQEAVDAVFQIKGRPAGLPLPVVVGDLSAVADLGVEVTPPMRDRLLQMWPAPLTVVLPIRQPSAASAGLSTLAVRIPQHDQLRELLIKLGRGLTATSANRSGEPAMLGTAEVCALLDGVDAVVVDGGTLSGGPPSTLVVPEGEGWTVLRQGAFPAERLL